MVSLATSTSSISSPKKRQISRSQVSLATCKCTFTHSELNEEDGTICLESKYFIPLWIMIFSLQVFLCSYLIGYVYIYYFIFYDPVMAYTFLWEANDAQYMNKLKGFMWSFVSIIGLHVLSMMYVIVNSFNEKRLVFRRPTVKENKPFLLDSGRYLSSRVSSHVASAAAKVSPFFDVKHQAFDVLFVAKEIFELVTQSMQAYNMSYYVANPMINHLAVFAIVINALSTPYIAWRYKTYDLLPRVCNIMADFFLDFCSAVILPFCIAYPYLRDFDPSIGFYPDILYYNDVWYIQFSQEYVVVMMVNWQVFIANLVPHIGLVLGIHLVYELFHHRKVLTTKPAYRIEPRSTNGQNGHSSIDSSAKSSPSNTAPPKKPELPLRNSRAQRLFLGGCHVFSFLLGITVLALHLTAQNQVSQDNGCKLYNNAWLVQGLPCAVMYVSCERHQQIGTTEEMTLHLQNLDRTTLQTYLIGHCPELEMPPILQEFPNLVVVEIYNSTLKDWNMDAAMKAGLHDTLEYVLFELTNLTHVPVGIMHDNLPPFLYELFFYRTNLTSFPEDIGKMWTTVVSIGLEFNPLDSFPLPITTLPALYDVVLIGNGLTEVPSQLFTEQMMNIWLSNNPISQLPDAFQSIPEEFGFVTLYAEDTNLTQVPNWILQWYEEASEEQRLGFTVSLYGSPYCTTTNASTCAESLFCSVACAEDMGSSAGTFPIDIIAPQRLP